MDTLNNQSPATQESVWEAFRENDRLLKESRKEFEREMEASRKKFERDLEASRKEFAKEMKASREEFDLRMKKQEELLEASSIKFAKEMGESRKEFDRKFGSWGNNFGSFAEEYFSNSFENGKQNFFGEKFDEIEKKVKGIKKGYKDEYDILMINGQSIGIVEVKFKAHENDVPKVLKKAHTFRVNFPEYKDHKVYLGLATMAFYKELEQECIEQGIAIVKQVGNTVVINDKHLKTF